MESRSNDWIGKSLGDGRYMVTARLGEGGMGAVYAADDRRLGTRVVIKVPHRSLLEDLDFARRFGIEFDMLARLSHPHIVKVWDIGEGDGLPFAVMQFLPGGSLEDRRPMGPDGPAGALDPRDVLRWLPGVARAVDYVNRNQIIHRDVKPANILFDEHGHPFLGDFGVIKVLAASTHPRSGRTAATGTGMVVGTPEYMAPELIMGDPFDGRADQYALAVTVYEMLGGRRPFEHETKTKVLVLHTKEAPRPLRDLCPWIPEALSDAVLRGLAKDPDERHRDGAALAEAVCAAVEAGFADKPERVRLNCPGCGRWPGISTRDYASLRTSGRPVPCPGCKTPIRLACSDPNRNRPGPRGGESGGGTIILTRGDSAKVEVPRRSGTVAEGINRNSTVVEPSVLPNQRTGTRIEASDGILIDTSPSASFKGSDTAPPVDKTAPSGRRTSAILAGAVAASVLVATIGLLALALGRLSSDRVPSGPAEPPALARSGSNTDGLTAPAIGAATSRLKAVEEDRTRRYEPNPAPGTKAGRPAGVGPAPQSETSASEVAAVIERAPRPRPGTPEPSPSGMAGGASSTPHGALERMPGTGPRTGGGFDPEPHAEREPAPNVRDAGPGMPGDEPVENVSDPGGPVVLADLKDVLAYPDRYANQCVELRGLVALGDLSKGPGGRPTIGVYPMSVGWKHGRVAEGGHVEFEIEAKLADQLSRLNGAAIMRRPDGKSLFFGDTMARLPAVITLKPNGRGGRVVKVELLHAMLLDLRKVNSQTIRLFINYRVITVLPERVTAGPSGNDDQWETEKRLKVVAYHARKCISDMQKAQKLIQMAQASDQLNRFMSAGIQNAIQSQSNFNRQAQSAVGIRP